jgi:hypothetical protein
LWFSSFFSGRVLLAPPTTLLTLVFDWMPVGLRRMYEKQLSGGPAPFALPQQAVDTGQPA